MKPVASASAGGRNLKTVWACAADAAPVRPPTSSVPKSNDLRRSVAIPPPAMSYSTRETASRSPKPVAGSCDTSDSSRMPTTMSTSPDTTAGPPAAGGVNSESVSLR